MDFVLYFLFWHDLSESQGPGRALARAVRMIDTEVFQQHFDEPTISDHTFCVYLARQFMAKKGFEFAHVPEAEQLAAASDIVLTLSDGFSLTMLCMVDRETYPNKIFNLTVDKVRDIGEACLVYTGKVNRAKMPVTIKILEVGPGSTDQQHRLQQFKRASLSAKVIPSAMAVDTVTGEVWSSSKPWLGKAAYQGFIDKLLHEPREPDSELQPPDIAIAKPSFPFLTAVILTLLIVVFAAEIVFGIGSWTLLLQPTMATLLGFGGLAHSLVLQSGEWYRIVSAPFLHVDAGHLTMNAIALYLAGSKLENLIGRAWFGAVYVVGALCGSLASLALNPASILSVGASGAIMGLFAAMLVASLHFPPGAIRTGLQLNAVYVLVPSLLPLAGALNGHKVDYGAHFGGAIGGVAMGFAMLMMWPRTSPWPGLRQAATAIALAGVITLAYPIIFLPPNYSAMAFTTQLIPADKYPNTIVDIRVQARALAARYPRDPRPHMMLAGQLLDANDRAGAEREARAGLAEENIWRAILPPGVSFALRTFLSISIVDTHRDEAVTIARPACDSLKDGVLRKLLDAQNLCST
jgi:rhomboid protease GluP